ncbi:MAG: hypothetical protein AB8U82_06730 [Rickettsia endosymbiont of Haemaphysalis japonica]
MSRTKEEYAAQIYAAEEHRRRQANYSDNDAESKITYITKHPSS